MSIQCDFCNQIIENYSPLYNQCSCKNNRCNDNCHITVNLEVVLRGGIGKSVKVCQNEIFKYGEKGKIAYYYRGFNDYGGWAVVNDPDYEPMRQELEKLRKENQILKTHISYMPGGEEYLAAKERFEEQDY